MKKIKSNSGMMKAFESKLTKKKEADVLLSVRADRQKLVAEAEAKQLEKAEAKAEEGATDAYAMYKSMMERSSSNTINIWGGA